MLDLSAQPKTAEQRMVGDPALRLCFDGHERGPVSIEGTTYTFVVPPIFEEARLRSRSGYADPASEDDRLLGVAIGRICLRSALGLREIALDHPKLERGLYACERQGARMWRWTDGDAGLAAVLLGEKDCPPTLVEIHLHSKLPVYRIDV